MSEQYKVIGIISTMDTKSLECAFLKKCIEELGYRTMIIDVGVMGAPQIKTDLSREMIAQAGGRDLKELQENAETGADRTDATEAMIDGVTELLPEAYEQGSVHGLIGLGGSTGSSLALEAMRALPRGVPKLLLTTVLDLQYVDDEDEISLFQSPCDILGLNSMLRNALSQAAGAITGMMEAALK